MNKLFLSNLFAIILIAQTQTQTQYVTPMVLGPIAISMAVIPPHGMSNDLWSHLNVFSLTDASTYSDGSRGDWFHPAATVNDLSVVQNTHYYLSGDITFRKNGSTLIAPYTYTGVTGPLYSKMRSLAYFDWTLQDNDYTGINFQADYYWAAANGYYGQRAPGSTYMALECKNASGLIPNCAQQTIVTPSQTGSQSIYVWTQTEGTDGTLTVTQGVNSVSYDVPAETNATKTAQQFTIVISPTVANTPYTVNWKARVIQPSATSGMLTMNAVALGGVTSGNVSDAVLATTGTGQGQIPSSTYGTRVHQLDPVSRIPTPLTSITLPLGGDLQIALNNAPCGQAIHLPLGYTYNLNVATGIILPHTTCTDATYIQIIADGARNTYGQRAIPADYPGGVSSPAAIQVAVANDINNADPSLRSAHHFVFRGVEMTVKSPPSSASYGIIAFGYGNNPTLASMSHDILFVGCYIHQDPGTRNQINAIYFNMDASGIYDSTVGPVYAPDFTGSNEVHGILVQSARGPMTFKNNYISGYTETMLFGGSAPAPFTILRDVEIVNNFFDKPLAWNAQPYIVGDLKNTIEFKVGQFVTVSNNVIEHSFAGYGQNGTSIFVRSFTLGGTFPNTTSNFLIENNILRHNATGIVVEAIDFYGLGTTASQQGPFDAAIPFHFIPRQYDVMIRNNSLEDMSFKKWGSQGRSAVNSPAFYLGGLAYNLTLDHNSAVYDTITDNAVTSTKEQDVAIYTSGISLLSLADRIRFFGGNVGGSQPSPEDVIRTFRMTNNFLGAGVNGDSGPNQLPTLGNYSNNKFFNAMAYVNTYLASNPYLGTFVDASTATPDANQGVNTATLPNDCIVITGNRSDVACTTGQ